MSAYTPIYASLLAIAITFSSIHLRSQIPQNIINDQVEIPSKLLSSLSKKSEKLNVGIRRSSSKYLRRLQKAELRLKRKLAAQNPTAAGEIFGDIDNTYSELTHFDSSLPLENTYSGHIDSMKTALKFLDAQKLMATSNSSVNDCKGLLQIYNNHQLAINQNRFIETQLIARQQKLKERLQSFGKLKEFSKYQQKIYYFRRELNEYKNSLEDPVKLESVLLRLINKIPSFRQFFNKYSQLASMFHLPGNTTDLDILANGLQTRYMVNANLQERLGTGLDAQQYVTSSLDQARTNLEEEKDKLSKLGQSGSSMDMPDFKPNNQKTKSFLERIELGANLQSVKSNNFFPVTTDFGFSVGYKINDKSIAGIGASYKAGLGRDIRHVSLTHQGVGFRSFIDVKLRYSIWMTGGGELNYLSTFHDFEVLKNLDPWQKSALVGIKKRYRVKKLNGNVQLLYDFLHNKQTPVAQPLIFRTGYTF